MKRMQRNQAVSRGRMSDRRYHVGHYRKTMDSGQASPRDPEPP